MNDRLKIYNALSAKLEILTDGQLSDLLERAESLHTGIGGKSQLLKIKGIPVFVKKVPLTDLENLPENIMSTANLFDLPLFYQYGVGSAGFNVWREISTHLMTTDWVLSGKSPHFPLLYHWRIMLSESLESPNITYWDNLDHYVNYWNNSEAVRRRIEAIHKAKAQILLFLEYVPQTLYQWLKQQLKVDEETAESAIHFVEQNLIATNDFMKSQGLLHFDAHFENILTDGKRLYFSDFGLALSSTFNLSTAEIDFFNSHQRYDQCSAAVNLLHCIITSLFSKEKWEIILQEYLEGNRGELAPALDCVIKRYARIAITMDGFYQKLQIETKTTPYPQETLELLCHDSD